MPGHTAITATRPYYPTRGKDCSILRRLHNKMGSSGSAGTGRLWLQRETAELGAGPHRQWYVRRTVPITAYEFPSPARGTRTERPPRRTQAAPNRNRTRQRSRTAPAGHACNPARPAMPSAAPFTGQKPRQGQRAQGSAAALPKTSVLTPGTTAATRPGTAGKTQEAPPDPRCTEAGGGCCGG